MLLASFVIVCFAVLVSSPLIQVLLTVVGLGISIGLLWATRIEIGDVIRHINYSNIGVGSMDRSPILMLVSGVIFGAAVSSLMISFTWGFMWQLSILIALIYLATIAVLMVWAHRVLYVEGTDIPQKIYHMPSPCLRLETEETIPDIPAPVYGVVRAAPTDVQSYEPGIYGSSSGGTIKPLRGYPPLE